VSIGGDESLHNAFEKSTLETVNEIKISKLRQLRPLILIFIYIINASILLHIKQWEWEGVMLDFMGLFYIVFSFFKFLDLKGFAASFKPVLRCMTHWQSLFQYTDGYILL